MLVYGYGSVRTLFFSPLLKPCSVSSGKLIEVIYRACSVFLLLAHERIRISLHKRLSVMKLYLIFIIITLGHSGNEKLKNPRIKNPFHLMASSIPVIEVADNRNPHRIWSPHCESNAGHAVKLHYMGTKQLIYLVMYARIELLYIPFRNTVGE